MVYHIARKDFPAESSLTLCRFGIEETRELAVEPPAYEEVYHILGLLNHLDFFQNMPISKAQAFISMVHEKQFSKGERIIARGTPGDYFYVIKSGNISVTGDNLKQRKIYGTYDYFGEAALLNRRPRAADVYAETDVELYTIEGERFLSFIQGTELERTLRRLSRIRDSETWNVLSTSSFFRILTSTQKTLLESLLIPEEYDEPGTILSEGEELTRSYIIRKGEVLVIGGWQGDNTPREGRLHRRHGQNIPRRIGRVLLRQRGPPYRSLQSRRTMYSPSSATTRVLMMKLVYDFLKI